MISGVRFPLVRSLVGIALVCMVALGALVGCGDSGEALVNPLSDGGSIAIQITRGATPKFDWAGGDTVHAISVYNFGATGEPNQRLWGYANIALTPPVTYGAKLTGGINLTGRDTAPPLQSGVRYRVEVIRHGEPSYANWIVP